MKGRCGFLRPISDVYEGKHFMAFDQKKGEIEETSKSRNYWWLIAFCFIAVSSLMYSAKANITEYYYDSKYYWNLGNGIFENSWNPINILRFPQSIRGYFFPVLLGAFKTLFHGVWGWRVLASGSMAVCFSLSLPYAMTGKGINSGRKFCGILVSYAVFMWVWGDLMQYPLSDFVSCFLLLSAIALLRAAGPDRKLIIKIVWGLLAGMLLYAAYNTRPTFLYSGVLVLLAYLLTNRKRLAAVWIVLCCMAVGMVLVALPQCYINNRHEGAFSPKVYYNLVESEVLKGLSTSRYETYTGDRKEYPRSGMIFDDLTGWEMIKRDKITGKNFKLSTIFELFLKYPLDMIGIYVRHLVSLLTPVYRQVYITNVYAVNPVLIVFSIVMWLVAALGVLGQVRIFGIDWNVLWILALCIPGLLQIFDEPELRFFLPIYLLCYFYVFAVIDYRKLAYTFKSNRLQTLVLFSVIFMLWISLLGYTLATIRSTKLMLSDNSAYVIHDDE